MLTAFQQTPPSRNAPSTEVTDWETLTDREQSILELMAQGQNNQEIAAALFLAPGTVKNNVSAILSKLHANDRTQAVLTALRRGLVDLK